MNTRHIYVIETINYYVNMENNVIIDIKYNNSSKILMLTDKELYNYDKVNAKDYYNMWSAKFAEFMN
jgi:hypothetical protein